MSRRGWVADPGVDWRILLVARPAGGAAPDVVISAHHAEVDGLGLLELLEREGYGPARSSARGVADPTPVRGLAAGIAGRLAEALLRPPARPTPPSRSGPGAPGGGDVLVEGEVPGSRRTTDLVHAAATAVGDWEAAHGRTARHIAIAIGASGRVRAAGEEPADDSVLLRLRDVEELDRDAIAAAIRSAHPEPSPHVVGGSRVMGATLGAGMRLLAPRLGSTLLVSHLGEVSAPAVERLTFYPVTAGGSGISLGAVGHAGRTTVTLRARARSWDEDGLERLLEAIIHRL